MSRFLLLLTVLLFGCTLEDQASTPKSSVQTQSSASDIKTTAADNLYRTERSEKLQDTQSEAQTQTSKSSTTNQRPISDIGAAEVDKIYFSEWSQQLPGVLPDNCIAYKAGCNRCSLSFDNGNFSGYACTDLGCAPEPYECLVEHDTDYFVIPEVPTELVFPESYTLNNQCAAVLYSNNGQAGYMYLEFTPQGFVWRGENKPYRVDQLLQDSELFEFLGNTALCIGDLKGNDLMYHPENLVYWEEYIQQQALQKTQNKKNTLQCMSYVENCEQTTLYYRPDQSDPPSKYGGLKTDTRNFPNCEPNNNDRNCLKEMSEYKLDKFQTELDLSALNTSALTSNRSLCFNRIKAVENNCVRYESECETCEVILDPIKESWRWDFKSKGCTQKYIRENNGLPLMQCAAYQN